LPLAAARYGYNMSRDLSGCGGFHREGWWRSTGWVRTPPQP